MAKGQLSSPSEPRQRAGNLRPFLKLFGLVLFGCFLGSLATMATADVCTQYDMFEQGGLLLVPFAVFAGMVIAPILLFFLFGADGAAGLTVAVPVLIAFGSGLILNIATFRRLKSGRPAILPAVALVLLIAVCSAMATFAFCVSMSA